MVVVVFNHRMVPIISHKLLNEGQLGGYIESLFPRLPDLLTLKRLGQGITLCVSGRGWLIL